ncbi:MAG: type IV pilus secretin PilQ, partial [Desulfobulbaceae bacterium]|nr:type IV pilus secretin PilQ [Desulfobulbaceae bacterium]
SQSISVDFVGTDIGTVLRALGRLANQNILISPDVKGVINTHIKDAPWNQVFMGILDSYNLVVSKEDNLLRVLSMDDLKRQLERKALHLEKEQVAPLETRIVTIEFSDPTGMVDSVKSLLTKDKEGKPRGGVSVDKHARALVIRDVADNMDRLLEYIWKLDRPTPQTLIEAHIVETTQDTARELGVQWGWGWADTISKNRGVAVTSGAATTLDTAAASVAVDGFGINLPANSINSVSPATIGFAHFSLGGDILDLQLSALQKAGKVNILSRPSIATLDNNKAVIESGVQVPYQTVEDNDVKVEYKDAVLRLTVTPHVISDELIRLDIEAKKDEVDSSRSVLGNPYIIKKLAQTQLIVKNGETVVIAGLSKEKNSNGNYGVPGLKDVPGLGWLFKNDARSRDFEELLIFITPQILSGQHEELAEPAVSPVNETDN